MIGNFCQRLCGFKVYNECSPTELLLFFNKDKTVAQSLDTTLGGEDKQGQSEQPWWYWTQDTKTPH